MQNPTKLEQTNIRKRLAKSETLLEKFDDIQNAIYLIEFDDESNMQEREKFESDYYQSIFNAIILIENENDNVSVR